MLQAIGLNAGTAEQRQNRCRTYEASPRRATAQKRPRMFMAPA